MANQRANPSKRTRRVVVERVISGRYSELGRPVRWNYRDAGIDKIETTSGEILTLISDGGQSTPQPGWEILLKDASVSSEHSGLKSWTLYGIKSL